MVEVEETFVLTSVRSVCRVWPHVEALPHVVQLIHAYTENISLVALPTALKRGETHLFYQVLRAVEKSSSLLYHEKLRQYRLAMHLVPTKMTRQDDALKAMKELYARYPGAVDSGTIYAVCEMAEMSVLKWLYACEPYLLFKKFNWSEETLFASASKKGREDVVRWLVKLFPDHVRSLEHAAEGGHFKMIKWLMKHAQWNEQSLRCAFINAVAECHLETAKFLHKTDPSMRKHTYGNVLVPVASKGNLAMLKWLQEIDCTFDYPLVHAAASGGHLGILQWLQTTSCTFRSEYPFGCMNAMDSAAENGHLEIVKFLHARGKEGCTTEAMDRAAANGHLEVVQWLHEHRTEGCTTDTMNSAARNGHVAIVEWLGTNRSEGTRREMDEAVASNHVEVAKWLYEHQGQDYPDQIVDKMAGAGNLEMIKWLHQNEKGKWSKKAMNEAASNGHLHVVEFLYENRCEGCTKQAMNNAAGNNHLEVVKWLHLNRQEGCSVLAINNASTAGHLEMVKWLHAHRREGCSAAAMTGAARNGHVRVMEFLAAHFSVKWLDTAMKNAIEKGHMAAVKWLHSHLQPLSRNDAATAARSDNIAVLEFIRANTEGCITPTVYYTGSGNNHPEVVKWYEDHYGNPRKRKHA